MSSLEYIRQRVGWIQVVGWLRLLPLLLLAFSPGAYAVQIAVEKSKAEPINSQPPKQLALPAERLMMEQAAELSQAGQIDEALRLLEKLLDESEGRLVPTPKSSRAGTLTTQRYIPLADWVRAKTSDILQQFPVAAQSFNARLNGQAESALAQLQVSKDPTTAQQLARRYGATELGPQFQLFLCDLYLEFGWTVAASQAAQLLTDELRVAVKTSPVDEAQAPPSAPSVEDHVGSTLPAWYVWKQLSAGLQSEQRDRLWLELLSNSQNDPLAAQSMLAAAQRLLIAAAQSPRELDLVALRAWSQQLVNGLSPSDTEEFKSLLSQLANWSPLPLRDKAVGAFQHHHDASVLPIEPSEKTSQTGSSIAGFSFVDWAGWSQVLEKYSASSDRLGASKPRVAETERGSLPYFPVVKDGRVYVNELTRVVAYDLASGEPWPDKQSALPLFDSHISAAAYLPLGYPMIGVPRGTVDIAEDCLYARMGSPITGRVNPRTGNTVDSASYLIGLDLSKQGSLLAGFPLHLKEPEFQHAEFDGPPLAWGEMLLVAVAERDHVGLRRSVAAFHRVSGELIWRSGTLAAGTVPGAERANLLAHQQLTLAGGRLFYNTNLGSIVCLDPLTGATQWLVQYSTPVDNPEYPQPNRYRYRDLTPCLLAAGLVICAPQDAPEIFALDALTGDLVWSSDDTALADVVHLLGTDGDSLMVSGDRLVWLDLRTGAVQGSFPASTTPMVVGALPSPRGLGRGYIAGHHVYWPTAGEILVFPTVLSGLTDRKDSLSTPAMLARLPVQPGGADGVNVLLVDSTLLVSSPSRLMAFPHRSKK
jgi:outer membrane protein assembly factor BamB